ncbi:hypothetical protein GSI_10064 [Ganoderma sinense ZZ0214-1]|uniref:BTB domain-containing protein n=1 Tax=Ganoderma sinense ZZ0214-1 TaxID=1077348 RepID=A0A2G8RZI3_9APHY|nr:hypothetical protein GSI_10064 [Ganoderma sinense ZZ0214-1]
MLSDEVAMKKDAVSERHPQLYFSNGDIVLAAKFSSPTSTASSPPQYQLYRVYKPSLSHHSPVFANLFGDAAPGELYDDVPLGELADVRLQFSVSLDTESIVILTHYFDRDTDIRRWDPETPIAVSPTIRIADKYLIDGLHKYLVQKVQDDWPLTLEDWDRREAEIEVMRYAEYISGARPSSSKPLAQAVPEPASAIRFALEFGCPAILPAAFYQLSRTDVTDDWTDPVSYSSNWTLPARWSLLEGPDLLRYLRGGKKLLQYVASVPRDVTFTAVLCEALLPWWEDAAIPEDVRWEIDNGRDAEEYPCYALLVRIFAAVFRETTPGVRDPLKALKECVDYEKIPEIARGSSSTKRLCSGCDWAFREWVPQARQKLWRKLPEYFGLPLPSP